MIHIDCAYKVVMLSFISQLGTTFIAIQQQSVYIVYSLYKKMLVMCVYLFQQFSKISRVIAHKTCENFHKVIPPTKTSQILKKKNFWRRCYTKVYGSTIYSRKAENVSKISYDLIFTSTDEQSVKDLIFNDFRLIIKCFVRVLRNEYHR